MRKTALLHLGVALLVGGCDIEGALGPGSGNDRWNLDASYRWALEGWETNGTRAIGHPELLVTWDLPTRWSGEAFRVYAKRSNESRYGLAATVTSCSGSSCGYTDRNVVAGETYDYYVAVVDRNDRESDASDAIRIDVPAGTAPATPAGIAARALDHGVFLQWGGVTGAERYVVYLEDASDLLIVGETDGFNFFDSRAENGKEYRYRVAGIDAAGHYSDLSAAASAVPRPDYRAEVIFAVGDSARLSGFHFRTTDASDPLVDGNGSAAQWRLERVNGVLSLRPLAQTQVTRGIDSSDLTCGPASDPDCTSVDRAPAATSFQSGPVAAAAAQTYVFRVTGDDGRTHYGKIRVLGATTLNGKDAVVFDWAYQLRPDDPSLSRGAR